MAILAAMANLDAFPLSPADLIKKAEYVEESVSTIGPLFLAYSQGEIRGPQILLVFLSSPIKEAHRFSLVPVIMYDP